MSKKTPVNKTKKSRRRLKRSVRRSLAAVMMITAIIIAAIPVPENYATDGSDAPEVGGGGADETPTTEPLKYAYSVKLTVDDKGNVKTNSAGDDIGWQDNITDPTGKDTEPTYVVLEGTEESREYPRLIKQFEYYSGAANGESYGIISGYNAKYLRGTIEIESSVITKYYTVSFKDYDDWYRVDDGTAGESGVKKGANERVYTCVRPGYPITDAEFLHEYFKDEYEQWELEYEAAEDKNGFRTFSKKVEDLGSLSNGDELKRKYYCDENRVNIGSDTRPDYISLKGYTLVRVIDESNKALSDGSITAPTENDFIYIPKQIEESASNKYVDSRGYLVKATTTINGIGDNVFKSVRTVSSLITSESFPLKYIGVSAFEDSYIQNINIANVTNISDRAFKGCDSLTRISMGAGNITIGTEAFYGTQIQELTFANSITRIYPGAFAECIALQKVDFSKTTKNIEVHKYAFYNTTMLTSVIFNKSGKDTTEAEFESPTSDANATASISMIGDGAFAVRPTSATLTSFSFPASIESAGDDGWGDCVLAGRSGLKFVTMPAQFGSAGNSEVWVPDDTFYYCFNLQCVKFPDNGDFSCGRARYNSDKLFTSVNTEGFYVKGPKLASGGGVASPRRSTWTAYTAVSSVVPYLYVENGKNYYEVSNGAYLLCIDNRGDLTSCTFMEGITPEELEDEYNKYVKEHPDTYMEKYPNPPYYLEIPSVVGTTKVVGIAEGCFKDLALNNFIRELKISDDSISEISKGVFSNWAKLEKVYIGNSVMKIGDEAFKNCKKLIDVTFNTPADYSTFTIGNEAFLTNGSMLTFHGDIIEGYAPFEWATDENNIINTDQVIDKSDKKAGIRVCYKSLAPSYLTVMYNPITEEVTLLDYPKYNQISDLLKEAHIKEIESAGVSTYEEWRAWGYYQQYADDVASQQAFIKAYQEGSTLEDLYASDLYGPWITPDFCEKWNNSDIIALGEDRREAMFDWLFEPIIAYAADEDSTVPVLKPYYDVYKYDIASNRDAGDMYRPVLPEETALLNAVEHIVVPSGVGSIDVYGYRWNLTKDGDKNSSDYNSLNVSTYLTNPSNASTYLSGETQRMYFGYVPSGNDEKGVVPGLFSGYYADGGESDTEDACEIQGNDRINTITLNSVTYLPKYAFDNCEQLNMVSIGANCSDIGIVPFRSCINLTNVNFNNNPRYTAGNGMIYSRNNLLSDTGSNDYAGTYTIEECLFARGKLVGVAQIPDSNFEDGIEVNTIGKVSVIRDGAFEDCDYIKSVVLTGASELSTIPNDCFKDCKSLQSIYLPRSVKRIDEGAFAYVPMLTDIYIPGKEVQIASKAFVNIKEFDKVETTIHTNKDSAAYRYAEMYKDTYNLTARDDLTEWTVIFLDSDGNQLGDILIKAHGSYLTPDEIPEVPEKEGWVFQKWLSTTGQDERAQITTDMIFIAQGYSANGMLDGVHFMVDFYCQIDGELIASVPVLPGEGVTPEPKPHDHKGYTFTKWNSDEWKENVQANLVIFALYSGSGSGSGGSGSGNTSKGSTNNNSNNGNSSTSGTSTSASATGKYTVTVVNGSGSGSYDVGTTVVIAANTPAAGKVFNRWTTDSTGVTLASVSMSATTFVMPANNVTVTANFIDGAPVASGTVGTGSNRNPGTNTGSTRVDITKPGISNKDLATATVNGSTDNFVVKISETDEATQAVINALTNKYGSLESILYYAMDISLYDSTGTTKITNTEGLTVDITIPIPDALTVFGGNNMAGAVINNQQLEELSERFTTINGIPCISFTATHFSPYTIYVNTQNLSEGLLDSTPKTGDPIHPKWFLSIGLASLSIILFMKRDKKVVKVKAA